MSNNQDDDALVRRQQAAASYKLGLKSIDHVRADATA
jgi:hypothetical protein